MSDGVLHRVVVSPLTGDTQRGTNWRSARMGQEARGHVAALGPTTFVTTDGSRGLLYWKLDDKGLMRGILSKKRDDEVPGLELDDRIVGPPLALPRAGDGPPVVLVADASGLVRTVKGTPETDQEVGKLSWDLGGRITAGPFLRTLPGTGPRVGCVVDGGKLVWINPAEGKTVLWTYQTKGAGIVGEPQFVDGKVVVADQAGTIVALDPATGKPVGPGYALPGSVAPAAPPVAFGADNVFTPLSDGTVVLLPVELFR
jgi:hypothetical protein